MRYLLCLLMLVTLPVSAQKYTMKRNGHVLAHSLKFNPDQITSDMPEALQELLRVYQTQPRYAQRTKGRAVEPLMRTVRHQDDPFNRSCPYYIDEKGRTSEERCIVGCVATSLEQVLTYYHYPEVLTDTLHGWQTDHYLIDDILPETRIDWPNILDDYRQGYTEAQAQAVSDLGYYCGMAVHMNWGLSSSGANLFRACEPLERVFGYHTVVFLSRAMYASPKWNALLRHELENGRPICYTGHNIALSGHAFNIDGVDEEGYYHVLWGYGGDYDGYFDLDYLNAFETVGNATPLGQHEGLLSNQTALFMHPDDVLIDIADSLAPEDAFQGVKVNQVTFRRQPDIHGYVIADFEMTNTTQDSLNFTFEVLTYLPTDTAIFHQADYVALSAVNLAPGERRTWPVYCHFTEAGERLFAFSADDETLPFIMPVNIEQGTEPVLRFGELDCRIQKTDGNLSAELSLDVTNVATAGYAGNLVTYCLFPEGSPLDMRHWEILSLAAGQTQRLTTRFQHLEEGKIYTLLVRCPWTVQQELTFTASSEGVGLSSPGDELTSSVLYDLSGRRASAKGIGIRNGRKYIIR